MALHRMLAEAEVYGDMRVAQYIRDKPEHLAFAQAEHGKVHRARLAAAEWFQMPFAGQSDDRHGAGNAVDGNGSAIDKLQARSRASSLASRESRMSGRRVEAAIWLAMPNTWPDRVRAPGRRRGYPGDNQAERSRGFP